jgi:hypothetical protein
MADFDIKYMRDSYTYSRYGFKNNKFFRNFADDVSAVIKDDEGWLLGTSGYDIIKNNKFLTHSVKKKDHPYLHYGYFFPVSGNSVKISEDDYFRLEKIDRAIDTYLRAYRKDKPGKRIFPVPINMILKTDNETIRNFTIGEYRTRFVDGSWVVHKSKVITDGKITFDNHSLTCSLGEDRRIDANVSDFTFIFYLEFSKDNKDYLIDSNVTVYIK